MDVMKRCLVILAVLVVAWPAWAPRICRRPGPGIDAYRRGDGAAALAVFEPLAEQGDRNAQFMMGVLHEDGVGIAKDMAKAIAWFRRAAEAGLASAQYNLAQYYENGTGVAADPSTAVGWYRRAAAQGHGKAQNQPRPVLRRRQGCGEGSGRGLDVVRAREPASARQGPQGRGGESRPGRKGDVAGAGRRGQEPRRDLETQEVGTPPPLPNPPPPGGRGLMSRPNITSPIPNEGGG